MNSVFLLPASDSITSNLCFQSLWIKFSELVLKTVITCPVFSSHISSLELPYTTSLEAGRKRYHPASQHPSSKEPTSPHSLAAKAAAKATRNIKLKSKSCSLSSGLGFYDRWSWTASLKSREGLVDLKSVVSYCYFLVTMAPVAHGLWVVA